MGNAAAVNTEQKHSPLSTPTDSLSSLLDSILNESNSNTGLPPNFEHLDEIWHITDENLEQRLKEISNLTSYLVSRDMNSLVHRPNEYHDAFWVLAKGFYSETNIKQATQKLVLKLLLRKGIVDFLKKYWKSLMKEFEAKKVDSEGSLSNGQLWNRYLTTQPHIVYALANVSFILSIFCNNSDKRETDIQTALYDEVAEFVLECLDTYLYPPETEPGHPQQHAVTNCLGIIHNFCNNHETMLFDLREKDSLRIIGKYRNCADEIHKLLSIFTFSHLLPEDDDMNKTVIELTTTDLDFVLKVLQNVLEVDEQPVKSGFHADEVILGVNKIAVVDDNKRQLVKAGVLPHYVKAMCMQDRTLQEYAAQGVWTLAFDDESVKTIKEEAGLMDALRSLAKSETAAVKAAADGALWKLEEETRHLQHIKTKKGSLSHIMISYQWYVKDKVLKVRQRLRKEGYRVWIDDESMSGNTLESMVKAVENAVLVVPVLTEKYKASNACRQEMSYANKLKKTLVPVKLQPKYVPDGWLAFILEDTYYHDLTKLNDYENKLRKFITDIKKYGKAAMIKPGEPENPIVGEGADEIDGPISALAAGEPLGKGRDVMSTPFYKENLKCVSWSEEKVTEWLKEHKLHKYSDKFVDCDGGLLAELAAMQFLAPESYYSIIKQDLGLAFIDILRLSEALRELNPAN